jgi:hypothetical protein
VVGVEGAKAVAGVGTVRAVMGKLLVKVVAPAPGI